MRYIGVITHILTPFDPNFQRDIQVVNPLSEGWNRSPPTDRGIQLGHEFEFSPRSLEVRVDHSKIKVFTKGFCLKEILIITNLCFYDLIPRHSVIPGEDRCQKPPNISWGRAFRGSQHRSSPAMSGDYCFDSLWLPGGFLSFPFSALLILWICKDQHTLTSAQTLIIPTSSTSLFN